MLIGWLLWSLLVIAYDFLHRSQPNWLLGAGLLLAITALAFDLQPFGVAPKSAFYGGLLGFLFLLLFYALNLMGAGDAKFAAVLGLWVGVFPLFPIWVGASVLAGIHALIWISLTRWPVAPRLFAALSGKTTLRGNEVRGTRQIPYAGYLALTSLIWVGWTG